LIRCVCQFKKDERRQERYFCPPSSLINHHSFFIPLSNRALKEGSWEDEKLGTWEAGELFFDAGIIFFMESGKEGSWEDRKMGKRWKLGSCYWSSVLLCFGH
jgi:hypothetical protein